MDRKEKLFLKKTENVAFDESHRKIISYNMSKYDAAVERGRTQFINMEDAKDRASAIKNDVINNISYYLKQFEERFTARGGKVIWAENEKQAVNEILSIATKNNAKLVVKSKSMTTEELNLNSEFEKTGIEVLETDLGEFIVQVAGEKPYHIVTPAMHKSRQDVSKLFHEKFGLPADSTPEQITDYVRVLLREKYRKADIGITGANFLVADTGSVAVTENEGNALMSTSFPRIHIAIAGIEKILPSIQQLHLIWPLLATNGTGQFISSYNTLFTGPRQSGETDGPEEMYVILLDNGRTRLLANPELREALKCMRCGHCLNACPVYKNIGGHSYDTPYGGPIGSVITPYYRGMNEYHHLSFCCSLCGACTSICPVRIPIHRLQLYNRRDAVMQGFSPAGWRFSMKSFRRLMTSRRLLNFAGGGIKNTFLRSIARKTWGVRRELPEFAGMSFNQLWRKNKITA